MSIVTFSENSEGYLIPFEDGKALCNIDNPIEQSEQWVSRQDFSISNEIIILGLGAGFHLKTLQENHPYLKVHIIECRDQLLPVFKRQIQSRVEHYHSIHSLEELLDSAVFETAMLKSLPVYFLEDSWGQQRELFYSLWKNLTGRSVYAIARHFANLGIEIGEESLAALKSGDKPLTIREATDLIIKSENLSAQENRGYFETLKELIR